MRRMSPPTRIAPSGFLDGACGLGPAEGGGRLMFWETIRLAFLFGAPQCAALLPDAARHRHRRGRRHRHGHHRLGRDAEGAHRHLAARQQSARCPRRAQPGRSGSTSFTPKSTARRKDVAALVAGPYRRASPSQRRRRSRCASSPARRTSPAR